MKFSLINRLSQSDIHELCALTQGGRNNSLKEQLYQLTLDSDRRVATNALWVFTHFALADNEWLYAKHDQLIDRCLNPNRSLEKVSCHFLMTAIRKTALYMLDL